MPTPTPDWQQFEKLVHQLHEKLLPNGHVRHDVKLRGNSGVNRQIDIEIRQNVGLYEVVIVIDCKKRSRKIDMNDVGAFKSLRDDVGASVGVIIASKGFTSGAMEFAQKNQIELLSLKSSIDTDWQDKLQILVGFEFRILIPIGLSIKLSQPQELSTQLAFHDSHKGLELDFGEELRREWMNGEIDVNPGTFAFEYPMVPPSPSGCLYSNFEVNIERYLQRVPLSFLGLLDTKRRTIFTDRIESLQISLEDIRKTWEKVQGEFPEHCIKIRTRAIVPTTLTIGDRIARFEETKIGFTLCAKNQSSSTNEAL